MIKREMVPVNETGLRVPQYSHFNETDVSSRKGKIRSEIDAIDTTDGQPYDLYDQLSDALNALNAFLDEADSNGWDTSDPAIVKYRARQVTILSLVVSHLT